jgi:hypothetical protein
MIFPHKQKNFRPKLRWGGSKNAFATALFVAQRSLGKVANRYLGFMNGPMRMPTQLPV